jgi:hypothetical protein
LVDIGITGAAPVGHQNGNVVIGVADVVVGNERTTLAFHVRTHGVEQVLRRRDVTADGADIGLDDAQREFHGCLQSQADPKSLLYGVACSSYAVMEIIVFPAFFVVDPAQPQEYLT